MEDFAQLSGNSRETKYDYSMEKLLNIIDEYCTFPVLEKIKLFNLTIFNFITGNEDQHLKNYSLVTRKNKIELSPVYDLINTTIALPNPQEEIALPIMGKKRDLTKKVLINYWGFEKLGLNNNVVSQILKQIDTSLPKWKDLIKTSFLTDDMQEKYINLISERYNILFG